MLLYGIRCKKSSFFRLFFQKVIRLLLFYGVRPVFQQVIQVYFVLFAAKLAVDLGNGVFIAQFFHLFFAKAADGALHAVQAAITAIVNAGGIQQFGVKAVQRHIQDIGNTFTLLQQGKSIPDILNMALDGFNPELLDSTRIDYCCDCSLDRVERTIRSLGKKEVEKLRDEDPIAEVNCQFCGKQYKVDLNDLLKNWPDTVEKQ